MSNHAIDSLGPLDSFDLETGLSLIPRIKLLLTVLRSDKSVSPIDDWKLKRSLIEYLKSSHSIVVSEEDLEIRKFKDLKKRKREDPVAQGKLLVHDLGFLRKVLGFGKGDKGSGFENNEEVEKKFVQWRADLVEKMNGMELNLEGAKFNLMVEMAKSDSFEGMKKEWEEFSAFGPRVYPRGERPQPDTIIVKGVPSRWFAEPRVSSKPSMLVTHTIFSAFGKIRNLDVAEDNALGKDEDEDGLGLVSGLHCKIVVRFEKYKDFCCAMKSLCGRSFQKEGSSLKADYEVTWDKDGYFRNSRLQAVERSRWEPPNSLANDRDEAPRRHYRDNRFAQDEARPRRFRE